MAKEHRNRRFDFSKSDVSRFDFTKDEPEDIGANGSSGSGIEVYPNTGKIVGWIVTLAAIFAGVYFFKIKGDDSVVDNGGTPVEQIAQGEGGKTTQPETAQLSDTTDDATHREEAVANNETKTPVTCDNSNSETPANADDKQSEKPSANETPVAMPAQPAQPKQNNIAAINVSNTSAPISGDVVENAKRVIRGEFGNGQERKDMLGSAYSEIQSKVNEMYRQGLVH